MPRKSRLEGIEQRVGAHGVVRYRGTATVHGDPRRGPWSTDPEQAIAWRAQTLRDAADGFLAGPLTLGSAIDEFTAGIKEGWITNKKDELYKPSVVRLYARKLEIPRQHFGAKTRLDTLRVHHVAKYKQQAKQRGESANAVRNTIVALRALYCWAVPLGHAVINPCAGIPLPTGRERKVVGIATSERASLLTSCLVGRDRTAFALSWLAGLRAGELLAMAWPMIDLDERELHVATAIDTITREEIDVKSWAGNRTVPIRDQLLQVLEDHAEIYGTHGLLFPASRPPADWTEGQVPESYSGLTQRLAKRWKAAGLEPLGLHQGRHTYVSILIAAGEEPKRIMQYAGHSSIVVTFDRYGHLFPADIKDSLRRMNAYDERQRME